MNPHPYAKLFPVMSDEELQLLAADIDEHGLKDPITTYEAMILDGRNRFEACNLIGRKPRFTPFDGKPADALAFVVSKNLHRRHLTESQRAMAATELANMRLGDNQYKRGWANLPTLFEQVSQAKAAALMQVSERSVKSAAAVKQSGVEELQDAVKSGDVPVSAAATVAKLSARSQRAAVAKGPKGVKDAAKKAREKEKDEPKPEPARKPNVPYTKDDGTPDLPGVYRPRFMKTNEGHEVVLDAHNNPVPDKVGDIFVDPELRDMIAEATAAAEGFEAVYQRVMKMKRKPSFPWVDISKVQELIATARNAAVGFTDHLREAVPQLACPKCGGSSKGCKLCCTVGYIPKVVYDTHPEYHVRKRGA